MPKDITIDMDMRRKPRSGNAIIKAEAALKRNWLLRLALRRPMDTAATAVALTAIVTIFVNAMFLQAGRHPSPLFGSTVTLAPNVTTEAAAPNPLPRPRPADAEARAADQMAPATKTPAVPVPNATRPPPAAASAPAAHSDPLANLIVTSQRVVAVQRALTDYGYGQIKPTGTIGSDTQAAIQKFERERKLPITGQMSERLVRELGIVTGRSVE